MDAQPAAPVDAQPAAPVDAQPAAPLAPALPPTPISVLQDMHIDNKTFYGAYLDILRYAHPEHADALARDDWATADSYWLWRADGSGLDRRALTPWSERSKYASEGTEQRERFSDPRTEICRVHYAMQFDAKAKYAAAYWARHVADLVGGLMRVEHTAAERYRYIDNRLDAGVFLGALCFLHDALRHFMSGRDGVPPLPTFCFSADGRTGYVRTLSAVAGHDIAQVVLSWGELGRPNDLQLLARGVLWQLRTTANLALIAPIERAPPVCVVKGCTYRRVAAGRSVASGAREVDTDTDDVPELVSASPPRPSDKLLSDDSFRPRDVSEDNKPTCARTSTAEERRTHVCDFASLYPSVTTSAATLTPDCAERAAKVLEELDAERRVLKARLADAAKDVVRVTPEEAAIAAAMDAERIGVRRADLKDIAKELGASVYPEHFLRPSESLASDSTNRERSVPPAIADPPLQDVTDAPPGPEMEPVD